jgi:hypothetical protein
MSLKGQKTCKICDKMGKNTKNMGNRQEQPPLTKKRVKIQPNSKQNHIHTKNSKKHYKPLVNTHRLCNPTNSATKTAPTTKPNALHFQTHTQMSNHYTLKQNSTHPIKPRALFPFSNKLSAITLHTCTTA